MKKKTTKKPVKAAKKAPVKANKKKATTKSVSGGDGKNMQSSPKDTAAAPLTSAQTSVPPANAAASAATVTGTAQGEQETGSIATDTDGAPSEIQQELAHDAAVETGEKNEDEE